MQHKLNCLRDSIADERASALNSYKSRLLHGSHCLRIAHERIPYKSGAEILSHDHRDSLVDPKYIRVIPVRCRMKGIDKAVSAPCLLAPFGLHRSKHMKAIRRKEWQRSSRRIRNDRPIHWSLKRWTAPGSITTGVVRCADAPIVLGI